jgi:hypothetical protein
MVKESVSEHKVEMHIVQCRQTPVSIPVVLQAVSLPPELTNSNGVSPVLVFTSYQLF